MNNNFLSQFYLTPWVECSTLKQITVLTAYTILIKILCSNKKKIIVQYKAMMKPRVTQC